jgi:tetratricopeptide (TPR) repeat protein
MLFDLRGRGRQRTVRVLYIGLALLIGVGLVGFGIGGGFGSGGILNAASNNEGSNGASFSAKIKHYRKLTAQNPADAEAWAGLTKAILQESSNFSRNGVTPQAKNLYRQASEAWARYLALNPPKASAELGQLMATVYSEEGLNEPNKVVQALEIVLASRPESAALWAQLAEYAYKARNLRVGDLASEKAVSLAPAAQRSRVKSELAELRASPSGEKSYTTTTNGKTYVVKKAPNGSYTGTELKKATPQPAGSGSTGTTTTKK